MSEGCIVRKTYRRRGGTLVLMVAALSAGAAATQVAGAQGQGPNTAPAAPPAAPEAPGAPGGAVAPPAGQRRAAPPVTTLEETIVTATRTPQVALDAPYSTDTVDQRRVQEAQFRSAPEALQEIPGVMVQKTAHGQGSPFIRGFTGFRTLFLIDGIRLNNSTFREGPNQYFSTVDPLSVNRFEVVKGPASVLYGSDAIGGTVNAITQGPTGYGEGVNYGASLYQRGSTAERSYIIHPEATVTLDRKLGFFAAGSVKEFGDLQGGDDVGKQENTGYDEFDGDFKAEYFLDPNRRVVFAYQRVQQNNVPRTHSTIFAESFAGSDVGSDLRRDLDQDRQLTYVQYHAEKLEGFASALRASLSWQEQWETEDRIRSSGARTVTGTDVGTLGAWVQLDSPTPVGLFTYGLEYYHDNVNSSSTANPIQGPVADDATYDILGLFVQDRIPLAEKLELTLGGRFNYARADADSVEDPDTGAQVSLEDDWSSFVGSARLSYFLVPDHWTVFGGASQGFRAPNLSDLTRLDFARSNELEVPAPGLDPEQFLSYELGVKASYEHFSVQLACFYTDIDGMIVRQPTGATTPDGDVIVSKANAGDGYVQGVELGGSYRFHPDWTVFGAASWQEGELEQFPTAAPVPVREPLSRVMPPTLIAGLRWDDPRRRFFVEGVVTVAGEQDELSTSDEGDTQRIPPGGTPGYEVLTLRTGWRVNEHALLTFAVENITDEDYRVHGSGVNAAGRNFIAGLELRF